MSALNVLLAEGDSITAIGNSGGNNSYFYQYLNWTPPIDVATTGVASGLQSESFVGTVNAKSVLARNLAVPGSRLDTNGASGSYPGDLVIRAPTWIDQIWPTSIPAAGLGGSTTPPNRNYILSVNVGTNDACIGSLATVADYAAAVVAYCAARQAAFASAGSGLALKIVLCTILPRNDVLENETNRAAFNSILTGSGWAAANGIAAIADLASQATMGLLATCANTTYYSDGVHPTLAGYALLEPIFAAAVNPLLM